MSIQRLIRASRAVTPAAEIRFQGIPDREDWVVCKVLAGGVILAESSAGPVGVAMKDVIAKLERMSQRIHLATVPREGDDD